MRWAGAFQLTSRLFTTCRSRPAGRRRHVPALHGAALCIARRAGGRQAAVRERTCYLQFGPFGGSARTGYVGAWASYVSGRDRALQQFMLTSVIATSNCASSLARETLRRRQRSSAELEQWRVAGRAHGFAIRWFVLDRYALVTDRPRTNRFSCRYRIVLSTCATARATSAVAAASKSPLSE